MSERLAAARTALKAGDQEGALRHAFELMRTFATPPFPVPLPGGFADVDALLDAVGSALDADLGPVDTGPDTGGDWVLATCLFETGGHTAVIGDLHDALPRGLAGVVLTVTGQDPAVLTPAALARTRVAPDAVRRADAPSLTKTARNALRVLREHAPRRLFLLHHPDDACAAAVAAALAASGTEVWIVHHADLFPTTGLFIPGCRLIDLTPRTVAFTRHVLGLDPVWLPLTCPDPGPPARRPRGAVLRTACSGSLFKTSQDAAVGYPDMLTAVLRTSGGTHVHIGPLRETQRNEIAHALVMAGIDPSRFEHLPLAPTLVSALQGERVDLLINSWPTGGARTTVEAMAAGVPVVWQSSHPSEDRVRLQMAWPGAAVWRRLADLLAIVNAASPTWLDAQSSAARRHYEERHHPSRWHRFFAAPETAVPLLLPAGYDAELFFPSVWHAFIEAAAVRGEAASSATAPAARRTPWPFRVLRRSERARRR